LARRIDLGEIAEIIQRRIQTSNPSSILRRYCTPADAIQFCAEFYGTLEEEGLTEPFETYGISARAVLYSALAAFGIDRVCLSKIYDPRKSNDHRDYEKIRNEVIGIFMLPSIKPMLIIERYLRLPDEYYPHR
jgi:hypothetical protein